MKARKAERPTRTQATYAYGIVRGASPKTASAPGGLPGTHGFRAVDVGDGLWILAADAPLSHYSAAAIDARLRDLEWVSERAMLHEAVVEHFVKHTTVVPMKLFTLFEDDARAVAHVRKLRRRIERMADRVSGCAEWGMRVHVDPRAVARNAARSAGPAVSGLAFLKRKKAQQEAARDASGRLMTSARRVFGELSAHAREARTRPLADAMPDKTLVLDAVFLVPSAAVKAFRAAATRAAKAVATTGMAVTLTGPWPPYHFVGDKA
jgi:hypothetical protein